MRYIVGSYPNQVVHKRTSFTYCMQSLNYHLSTCMCMCMYTHMYMYMSMYRYVNTHLQENYVPAHNSFLWHTLKLYNIIIRTNVAAHLSGQPLLPLSLTVALQLSFSLLSVHLPPAKGCSCLYLLEVSIYSWQ